MGLSTEQTGDFMNRYIDETLKMDLTDYSEAATEAADEAIGAMVDYVDLVNEDEVEEDE